MHNRISLWFIFIDDIDYILKNIYTMKEITDDIHIYARNRIEDKNTLDIFNKYNIKINYKNNRGIKYIFKKSKYNWSVIVESNSMLISENLENIYRNIDLDNEFIDINKYIVLKNNIK